MTKHPGIEVHLSKELRVQVCLQNQPVSSGSHQAPQPLSLSDGPIACSAADAVADRIVYLHVVLFPCLVDEGLDPPCQPVHGNEVLGCYWPI